MKRRIGRFIILLILAGIFVCPVSAKQISGTADALASGTTSVTATVEISSDDADSDKVKTGDDNQQQVYLLLFLMSGIVILSNAISVYRKEEDIL